MNRTTPLIHVTDHAVTRWFERVERYDIDGLRAYLARAAEVGLELGASVVVVPRAKLILADDRVVTVLRADQDALHHHRAVMEIDHVIAHREAKRRRR